MREPSSKALTKEKKRLEAQHQANMKWIAKEKAKLANIMKKGMKANTTKKAMKGMKKAIKTKVMKK